MDEVKSYESPLLGWPFEQEALDEVHPTDSYCQADDVESLSGASVMNYPEVQQMLFGDFAQQYLEPFGTVSGSLAEPASYQLVEDGWTTPNWEVPGYPDYDTYEIRTEIPYSELEIPQSDIPPKAESPKSEIFPRCQDKEEQSLIGSTEYVRTDSRRSSDNLPAPDALGGVYTEAFEETDVPEGSMTISLMMHQRMSLCWMIKRESNPIVSGGILADDQGLGKMVTSIALILSNPPSGQSLMRGLRYRTGTLVICPAIVLRQWEQEIQSKVSSSHKLNVLVHHGKGKAKTAAEMMKYDVVLTTYQSLSAETDKDRLEEFMKLKRKEFNKKAETMNEDDVYINSPLHGAHWHRIILDESQCIKNPSSICSRAVSALWADSRWCLSGTPIQNSVMDLYPAFRFLDYAPYCDRRHFKDRIKQKIDRNDPTGFELLRKLLSGVLLRRTKTCCINGQPIIQLPSRQASVVEAQMGSDEQSRYAEIRDGVARELKDLKDRCEQSVMNSLVLILRLRQASSHPFLVNNFVSSRLLDWSADQMEAARNLTVERRSEMIDQLTGSDLPCPLCHDLPDGPVLSHCNHVFCRPCLVTHSESKGDDGAPCPLCDQSLKPNQFYTKNCLRVANGEPLNEERGQSEKKWESSAKLDKLMELMEEMYSPVQVESATPSPCSSSTCFESGMPNKVLVFSQWTSMLDLIEVPLKERRYKFERLDGSMTLSQRAKAIDRFKSDETISVMLISLKSASLGLNLVCANHVILMDPWWNPAVEEQAIDRAHRIGQTRCVNVTRIIVKDTIDERIMELQEKKRTLAASTLDGHSGFGRGDRLSLEDINFLFGSDGNY